MADALAFGADLAITRSAFSLSVQTNDYGAQNNDQKDQNESAAFVFDFRPAVNAPLAHSTTPHRSLRRGDADGGGGGGGLLPVYTEEHLFFWRVLPLAFPSLPSPRVFHPVLCPCFGKRKAD